MLYAIDVDLLDLGDAIAVHAVVSVPRSRFEEHGFVIGRRTALALRDELERLLAPRADNESAPASPQADPGDETQHDAGAAGDAPDERDEAWRERFGVQA